MTKPQSVSTADPVRTIRGQIKSAEVKPWLRPWMEQNGKDYRTISMDFSMKHVLYISMETKGKFFLNIC